MSINWLNSLNLRHQGQVVHLIETEIDPQKYVPVNWNQLNSINIVFFFLKIFSFFWPLPDLWSTNLPSSDPAYKHWNRPDQYTQWWEYFIEQLLLLDGIFICIWKTRYLTMYVKKVKRYYLTFSKSEVWPFFERKSCYRKTFVFTTNNT